MPKVCFQKTLTSSWLLRNLFAMYAVTSQGENTTSRATWSSDGYTFR